MADIYHLPNHIPSSSRPLLERKPILLYHIYYGRNAWYSTWISKYVRKTLMNSHANAYKYVDRVKTPGSVFGLTVLPGWFLGFEKASYVVAEINSNRPFSNLKEAAFLRLGISEAECLSVLSPQSDIWSKSQRQRDGVIVQQTDLSSTEYVDWKDRTKFPGQQKTVGHYRRIANPGQWHFSPIKKAERSEIQTSFFRGLLGEIKP
jgi:hypothetical protein